MLGYRMVWCGVVWYGMVWYGMVCMCVCTCVCIMYTHDTHSIWSACSRSTSTRCMRAFRQEGAERSPRSIAFALMLPRLMDTLTIRAGSMWLVLPATAKKVKAHARNLPIGTSLKDNSGGGDCLFHAFADCLVAQGFVTCV